VVVVEVAGLVGAERGRYGRRGEVNVGEGSTAVAAGS